jgi:adenylosuccinate synthase
MYWEGDISGITSYDDLPNNAKSYIQYVSDIAKVKISLVSVGSRRNQTIHLLTL